MGDYDYANARLRAYKSQLFDARVYAEFSALTNVNDLIARLADSTYGDEIKAALARYDGVRVVMEACRLHLAATFHDMQNFFNADGARLVRIVLARWDLLNLKTILRGQTHHVSAQEILPALVPAGALDESALRALVGEPEPLATIDLLRTWNVDYARAARQAYAEFSTSRDWMAFETAFDKIFYAQLLAALQTNNRNDALVREWLAREIDALNVMTALRWRSALATDIGEKQSARVSEHLIRGGTLPQEWLLRLTRATREQEALAQLRTSPFQAALSNVETFNLVEIQRELEHALAEFGTSFFARDPLTIATAIGFITAKNVEAKNIRLLAQGLALGWTRAEIEKELIV